MKRRHDLEPESYSRDGQILPYVGVVEDVADPMQVGRVRVRAIGFHPEKAEGAVPTEHLPWAYVMLPTTASGMSGIGSTHGLVDGSWVFGFFLDGRDAQQPIVVGSFVGAPGLTPMQQDIVQSNMAISAVAAGPMGGYFQTALAKAVGGLGLPTRFGATVGGMLNLVNMLKNQDVLRVIQQVSGAIAPSGAAALTQPVMAKVMDRATVAEVTKAVSTAASTFKAIPGLGSSALVNGVDLVTRMLASGGASGFQRTGGASPLSGAAMGNLGPPGSEMTAETAGVSVRTDYDKLIGSLPEGTGALVVHGTGSSKHSTYTIDAFRRSGTAGAGPGGSLAAAGAGNAGRRSYTTEAFPRTEKPELSGYDFVIDQTGQIIRGGGGSGGGSTAGGSFSVGGQSAAAVSVALIGGRNGNSKDGRGPIESLYWPVQIEALQKLATAFMRKFPQGVITGAGEVGTGSAGFNVSEWARTLFGGAANAPTGGVQRLSGSYTDTVGALAVDDSNVDSSTSLTGGSMMNDVGGRPRGFMGGPSHPSPAYALRRESDVPAYARTNALTMGRGTPSTDAASGGPGSQYTAVQAEPHQYAFKKARAADTLEARQIPENWQVPEYPHGGEYGRTHVVRSTEGGHHVVLDDTPGRQKVEVMHSTGSMLQIQADGSGVFYIKKDGYEVVLGDKRVGVHGSLIMSVGGDMRVSVEGDLVYDVTGKILFNGASDMTELIRGDRSTVTEGSHLFQAKKNATHRVGKDMSTNVGGKATRTVRGNSDDTVDGNRNSTTHGDSTEFNAGNRNTLTAQTQAVHAGNLISQSQGENIQVSKGNTVVSAKGKATVVAEGNVHVESKADVGIKSGAEMGLQSGSNFDVKSGGRNTQQSSGVTDVKAGGNVNVDGATINLNSGMAGTAQSVDAESTADVEPPPEEGMSKDGNPASSEGNLDAEQVTRGEMDAAEAGDESAENGGSAGGGGGGGGYEPASFAPSDVGGPLSPSQGIPEDACSIANELVARGWSKEGAAAITGNMIHESNLNPMAYNENDVGRPAGGLIQWRAERLTALQRYSAQRGLNWRTREAQIGFLDQEARGSHAGMGGAGLVSGSGGLRGALAAAARYESYQGWQGGAERMARDNDAAGIYEKCFGGDANAGYTTSGPEGYTGGSDTAGQNATDATGATEGGTGQGDLSPSTSGGNKGAYATGGPVDWGRKVSPNFTLGQLCPTSKFHAGQNPTCNGSLSSDQLIRNLSAVAVNVLEPILATFGRVTVMSGYRSLAYNNALRRKGKGAARCSDHLKGMAVDIKVPGLSPAQVARWVDKNIDHSGLGRYPSFTHVSYTEGGSKGRKRYWGRN